MSNDKRIDLDFILTTLSSTHSHARCLAYLIMRCLISVMSGEERIVTAQRALNTMSIKSLKEFEDQDEFNDEVCLSYMA
jgi:hypothetical protein